MTSTIRQHFPRRARQCVFRQEIRHPFLPGAAQRWGFDAGRSRLRAATKSQGADAAVQVRRPSTGLWASNESLWSKVQVYVCLVATHGPTWEIWALESGAPWSPWTDGAAPALTPGLDSVPDANPHMFGIVGKLSERCVRPCQNRGLPPYGEGNMRPYTRPPLLQQTSWHSTELQHGVPHRLHGGP